MNTGGPAFPTLNEHQAGNQLWQYEGMTLRDYFAAKVLPAIYSDYVEDLKGDGERVRLGSPGDPGVSAENMAQECYAIADAMLKAREQ